MLDGVKFVQHSREVSASSWHRTGRDPLIGARVGERYLGQGSRGGDRKSDRTALPVAQAPASNTHQLPTGRSYLATSQSRYCTYLGCKGYHLFGIGF